MYIEPSTQREHTLAPEGLHTGVLYQVIDLGSHHNDMAGRDQRKVRLSWELSEELTPEGKPLAVSREYTLSSNEKAILHHLIKGWTGEDISKGFDLRTLLGKAGNVNVKHGVSQASGNKYVRVEGVAPLKKSETAPPPVNKLTMFDMTGGVLDNALFESLPEFLRDKIAASPEYRQLTGKPPVADGPPAE